MKVKLNIDIPRNSKRGDVVEIDDLTAQSLIGKGQASMYVEPVADEEPAIDFDKPVDKCNLAELTAIAEKEEVELDGAKTKKEIVAAIEEHRQANAEE